MTETILPMLETYYRRAFPDRADACLSDLNVLSIGWESDVYGFTAAWGAGQGEAQALKQVLRIYPGDDRYEKSFNEFHAMRKLKESGYPVPRVDRLERDASPFGKPFVIMEFVPGKPTWLPMFNGPEDEQRRLRDAFCRLQAQLHKLDWRPFVANPAEYESLAPNAIPGREIARWQDYIHAFAEIPPGWQKAFDWLFEHARDVPDGALSVCHWDFHPENMLKREPDGALFVIDWTGLEVTDPRFDLAWTLLLLSSVEGAQVREPMLRGYEQYAGHRVEGMEFFDAAACLRRLASVIISLAVGPEKLGMRPEAAESMRRQARRTRFVYDLFLDRTAVHIPEAEEFFTLAGV
jgi:aminoglycoside phosphotransferase (APT) family kinase protein